MSDFFAPSLKELLYQQAEKYADKTFIKFVRDGKIETKSYNCLKNHSNAVCRYIRSISNKKMHVAVVGKTNYEYTIHWMANLRIITCCQQRFRSVALSAHTVILLVDSQLADSAIQINK